MDEDTLNDRGSEPLFQFVQTVRDLFRGKTTDISEKTVLSKEERAKRLSAALSYLHSRGKFLLSDKHGLLEIDGVLLLKVLAGCSSLISMETSARTPMI